MKEQPHLLRYCLTITGTEHGEWQGVLENDSETRQFKSILQLLKLIHQDELRQKGSPAEGFARSKN